MELSREFRERFVRSLQGRDYILYGARFTAGERPRVEAHNHKDNSDSQ